MTSLEILRRMVGDLDALALRSGDPRWRDEADAIRAVLTLIGSYETLHREALRVTDAAGPDMDRKLHDAAWKARFARDRLELDPALARDTEREYREGRPPTGMDRLRDVVRDYSARIAAEPDPARHRPAMATLEAVSAAVRAVEAAKALPCPNCGGAGEDCPACGPLRVAMNDLGA